jgi:hypothetical protein
VSKKQTAASGDATIGDSRWCFCLLNLADFSKKTTSIFFIYMVQSNKPGPLHGISGFP